MTDEEAWFCGRTETLTDSIVTRPWPVKRITYRLDTSGFQGSLQPAQLLAAFDEAWHSWAQYLDLDPTAVDAVQDALVRARFALIDGSGKVLAWSELANGVADVKTQQYDSGDVWTVADQPTGGALDILRVYIHEIGHMLGLTHDNPSADAIMAPTYSQRIIRPTARDVNRLLALGYKARPVIVPPPPPPPGGDEKLVATIQVYSNGRVVKV